MYYYLCTPQSLNYNNLAMDIYHAQNKQNNQTRLCKAHVRSVKTSGSKLSSEHIKDLFYVLKSWRYIYPCIPPVSVKQSISPLLKCKGEGTNDELHLWWPNITVNRIQSPWAKVCEVCFVTVKTSHISVNILAESDKTKQEKIISHM